MSNMQVKIVAVELNTAKTKTGKDYQVVEVTYKNLSFDGKVESKKHNQYGDKTVFNALKDASPGDVFTIERKKDDAGYWQWVGIGNGSDSANNAPAPSAVNKGSNTANPAPKSNWETPEERQNRQRLIVRQSSITSAISILKTEKNLPTKEDVFTLAEDICAWVFEVKKLDSLTQGVQTLEDYEEDIPV